MKICNWGSVLQTKKLENIKIETSSGTFKELLEATKNISYFRGKSNYINFSSEFDIAENDFEISLQELSYSFPDLKKSAESWLGFSIPSSMIESLMHENGKTEIGIRDITYIKEIFPETLYPNLTITENSLYKNVVYESDIWPHISQKWESSFQIHGDLYVHPPFSNNIFLNDISKMFATTFILGTISRYYPTTWMNITSGIENDRILPFAINFMDFIQEKFPNIILDFINAPYKLNN